MGITINRDDIGIPEHRARLIIRAVRAALSYAGYARYTADITITDNQTIREVNKKHRNKDAVTDCLSFPQYDILPKKSRARRRRRQEPGGKRREARKINSAAAQPLRKINSAAAQPLFLGDIIISYEKALAQAQEYGHSPERELAFLAAHSALHLAGYDHTDINSELRMLTAQKRVIKRLGVDCISLKQSQALG